MNDLNFTVYKEKCIKCNLCKNDCPAKVIETDIDGYPCSSAHKCTACQHCLAICPQGAISVFGRNPDNSAPYRHSVNSDDLMNLIENRRSCRQYKRENIDREKMKKLKNMLNWVPTGCNFKDLHFSIVEDINVMDSIREDLYADLGKLVKFIPTHKKIQKYKNAILNKEDFVFRNAPHVIVVSANKNAPCKEIDPIIALSYFELYAQTLGLGTVWCGLGYWTIPLSKKVMKRLEIPKTHKLSYVMVFGNPAIEYKRGIQPDYYEMTTVK